MSDPDEKKPKERTPQRVKRADIQLVKEERTYSW